MRLLAVVLLFLAGLSHAHASETSRISILHDGETREALIDMQAGARNAPVLIALHGGIAGPRTIRRRANVTLANQGWVVIWPYALDDWNDGRRDRSGQAYDTADDIGFLRKLIGDLSRRGIIDPKRVFFAGPSIGGMMVLRVLCEAPDLVAGAAIAIASLPAGQGCRPGPAKPVVFLHSTADEIVPPQGGAIGGDSILVKDRGRVRPVNETMRILAERNRCTGRADTPLPDLATDDASTVTLRQYTGCSAPLVHYVVQGGGHTWPGSRPFRIGSSLIGATNQDISATRIIQDFFKRLSRQ